MTHVSVEKFVRREKKNEDDKKLNNIKVKT